MLKPVYSGYVHNVEPIRPDTYERAMAVAFSAGSDWQAILAAAQTLSHSPDWKHRNVARHLQDAYELHMAGLLKPADPARAKRDEMIAQWKAAAEEPAPRNEFTAMVIGGIAGVLVAAAFALLGM